MRSAAQLLISPDTGGLRVDDRRSTFARGVQPGAPNVSACLHLVGPSSSTAPSGTSWVGRRVSHRDKVDDAFALKLDVRAPAQTPKSKVRVLALLVNEKGERQSA